MAVLTDPEWLAHRYDPSSDAVALICAPRTLRRSVPFLTDEYLKPGPPDVWTRREAWASRSNAAPVHFIFHSAYCCSTLLAAAFDAPGAATSFKEPVILNDIVGWLHRGAGRRAVAEVLDGALAMLTPFERSEAAIVKPSNVVNGLAPIMLSLRPDARAILMRAPLRVFLASIARKGMWGRLWVRELLSKQLIEGLVDLGFEPDAYVRQTDLQTAAVGWLAQARLFAKLEARWPDRVRTLDSEQLVGDPVGVLSEAAAFYRLDLSSQRIETIVADVFSRDAKSGGAFTPNQRTDTAHASLKAHAEEIDMVATWADAVAANAGIDLTRASSLRSH